MEYLGFPRFGRRNTESKCLMWQLLISAGRKQTHILQGLQTCQVRIFSMVLSAPQAPSAWWGKLLGPQKWIIPNLSTIFFLNYLPGT